jgi:hypothetical protein
MGQITTFTAIWSLSAVVAFHFSVIARAESGVDAVYFLIKGGGGQD